MFPATLIFFGKRATMTGKTMPMLRLSMPIGVTSTPSNSTLPPASGASRPAMMRSVVVLPQPDGPRNTIVSPGVYCQIKRLERARAVRTLGTPLQRNCDRVGVVSDFSHSASICSFLRAGADTMSTIIRKNTRAVGAGNLEAKGGIGWPSRRAAFCSTACATAMSCSNPPMDRVTTISDPAMIRSGSSAEQHGRSDGESRRRAKLHPPPRSSSRSP